MKKLIQLTFLLLLLIATSCQEENIVPNNSQVESRIDKAVPL